MLNIIFGQGDKSKREWGPTFMLQIWFSQIISLERVWNLRPFSPTEIFCSQAVLILLQDQHLTVVWSTFIEKKATFFKNFYQNSILYLWILFLAKSVYSTSYTACSSRRRYITGLPRFNIHPWTTAWSTSEVVWYSALQCSIFTSTT